MLRQLTSSLNQLLYRPVTVFWICLALGFSSILFDGSFLHLWSLHRSRVQIESRIEASREKLKLLEFQIQEAQQPQFIERQARDQFDLVKEGDLIFIFSEDGEQTDPVE